MSSVRDIDNFLDGCEQMIAAMVAQACTDYYAYCRNLMNGNYYDPSDPKAKNEYKKGDKMVKYISRRKLESKIEGLRDWFTNPGSLFNSFWKTALSQIQHEESCLDGKAILDRLDDMVADTTTFPENVHSFRQNTDSEEDAENYYEGEDD